MSSMTDLAGYVLETRRLGSEYILYRGRHAAGNAAPILVLAPAAAQQSPANLERLEHEYALASELDPEWAVQPSVLARRDGHRVLVFEDPGGEPLDRLLGKPLEISEFLRIAIALAGALRRVHERGLIHKDIKPANVLVDVAKGGVWLTGFGIASRLPRERQHPGPPEEIAGTLAYMAPEQTGRMNRSIDSRSDLYALGITFYEMLTGTLPFRATDPMEWIHCHIARQPVPPSERVIAVPAQLSAIVMKLLAKTAEERYQTAAGVEADLRRSLAEWESHGSIALFALSTQDAPDRLGVPEKLYGREREIGALLDAFNRVVIDGTAELVLVSGYSGIGKSSVVNELHKALVPSRCLFASGKFDQYKRDIPYATLGQAFQSLVRSLLAQSEAQLGRWRDALREALDPNGQLIVDLVPELKLIIGEQAPVPELPPRDAQGRFQLVFRRFISVFTREHPLALFLDDLQWLDAATLDLMEDLLIRPDLQRLMLIGAYRNNEVNSTHPLMRKLEAIRQAGAIVHDIVLAPLAREDLRQLVADSLHCEPERAEPLTKLIHDKTAGNPFFAIQFFSALAEESLLTFNYGEAQWSWDLNGIYAKGYTDNVVDLIVGKLNCLPVETQKALQQLACMGNRAEFAQLAMIFEDSTEEMHGDLREAVRAGLVVHSERAYTFLHDRVQEAAYFVIPEGARGAAHLRIGRLLAARTAPAEIEEKIFEIVNQLNRGSHLITSGEERERVAALNFIAGRRAKISTAYAAALAYLAAGRALLTEESWEHNYELIFAIEFHMAECELLTANMAVAEDRLSMLARRARTVRDIAAVARLRLTLYTTLGRSDRGVEVCLEYLQRGGAHWSPRPTSDEVRSEYDRIWSQIGSRSIEELIDLPLMKDPDSLAALDVLTEIVTPALFTDDKLFSLVICRMVNLSLEHGNSDGSCFAYVFLGIIAGPRFGNYKAGFRFGQLGYELVEKRGLKRYQARTYMSFGSLVMPWTKHIRTARDLLRRAIDAASKIGDITFAAYSAVPLGTNFLAVGDPLVETQRETENSLEVAQKARFGLVIDIITAQLGLIRTLRGLTPKFGSFNDERFEELRFERHLSGDPVLALPECWYWIRKLQARFFAGDYASAVDASLRAQRLLWTSPSLFETAEYVFYGALSRAASCDSAAADQRQQHVEALAAHHRQLEMWAENCPENFENRAALVSAEIARIQGRELDAEHLYEQAIRSAHENGFVHNEAIANELAAHFYAARGFEKIAHAYLQDARYGYLRWGADGKVRQMDLKYPHLVPHPERLGSGPTLDTLIERLDLTTVVKLSQAVAGEIEINRLIKILMETALEHAGAERGLLILPRGEEMWIEAEAITAKETVEVHRQKMRVGPVALPESVFHYVIRTRDSLLLDEAMDQEPFSQDPYILRSRSRSILCLPLIKQAQLIGVLYLENGLASHVFTPARIALLRLLASQAATSLENARLYSDLRNADAYLAEAQRLSHTGSFGWIPSSGEIYWSEETFRIFEFDRTVTPSVDLLMRERVHPEDVTSFRQVVERAAQEGRDFTHECRLRMSDGAVKYLYVVAHAMRYDMADINFVGAVMDVTAMRLAELELRKTRTELAHVMRVTSLGELTASIAHEVNQPLGAVVTNAEACLCWLDRENPNLNAVHSSVEMILRDGNRAGEIIRRVRALAMKTDTQMVPLNLNDVVSEAVAFVQHELLSAGVSLRTELATALPLILADKVQLQQVIVNLVINGIEAMHAITDRARELVIRSEQNDAQQVQVTVTDCGIGFSEENAQRLFDAFFTTKSSGMGMGLSICRSIIEAHCGRVWAASNGAQGAVIRFTLPVHQMVVL
jgi:predicted ATPase/signal transduction histidine kinase/GAF domain-containing protein